MRIVAGELKGRRFEAPRGSATRPSSDFIRETAFNLIGPVEDARVVDLYAGSGGLGLEALSRGAADCLFVDNSRQACSAIEANLARLGLAATVRCRDVVALLAAQTTPFDLVLCDPPYELDAAASLAPHLARLLAADGLVVYQTAAGVEPELPGLELTTSRRYGSARLTLFAR